jgi:hypothetical protein
VLVSFVCAGNALLAGTDHTTTVASLEACLPTLKSGITSIGLGIAALGVRRAVGIVHVNTALVAEKVGIVPVGPLPDAATVAALRPEPAVEPLPPPLM